MDFFILTLEPGLDIDMQELDPECADFPLCSPSLFSPYLLVCKLLFGNQL